MATTQSQTQKFQMVLPDELGSRLRSAAMRQRIPLAQFIRDTMEKRVRELESEGNRPHLFQRLSGMGAGIADTDLSERVDDILYGTEPHS